MVRGVDELKANLKKLIVTSLELHDVEADSIDNAAPLFGEGLGLDSIDALELAVALNKTYGISLRAEDEGTKQAFHCIDSLAEYVHAHAPQAK